MINIIAKTIFCMIGMAVCLLSFRTIFTSAISLSLKIFSSISAAVIFVLLLFILVGWI